MSAQLVKELRERSGAGMMDCKKALDANNNDVEAAIDWLRTKGLASAAKKAGRVASEGLVAVASNGKEAVVVELNSETDFVARNEQFQQLVEEAAQAALTTSGDAEAVKSKMADKITAAVATIGENMNLRRIAKLAVKDGVVATYVHSAVKPGMGKIGVLVALESAGKKDALEALGKQIAMHVAAAKPEALHKEGVDAGRLERERAVLIEQAIASGKPKEVAEKMVEGRIRKFYEEVVLLEQAFVMDGKTKIADVVKAAEKDAGAPITLKGFERFSLGEGIDKPAEDFAAEVAKTAGVA